MNSNSINLPAALGLNFVEAYELVLPVFLIEMHFLYVITNRKNGKQYVGQTREPDKRWNFHRCHPRAWKTKLYLAMQKYGVENFTFEIVLFGVSPEMINAEEISLIAKLDTYRNGYNSTTGGSGSAGCKATDERRRKISESKVGKKRHPETVEKMRTASLGKKMTPESSEKKRVAMLGRIVTPYMRSCISRTHKGKIISTSQREHLRKLNTGKTHSEETRKKISLALTGGKRTAASRLLMSQRAIEREARNREKRKLKL